MSNCYLVNRHRDTKIFICNYNKSFPLEFSFHRGNTYRSTRSFPSFIFINLLIYKYDNKNVYKQHAIQYTCLYI